MERQRFSSRPWLHLLIEQPPLEALFGALVEGVILSGTARFSAHVRRNPLCGMGDTTRLLVLEAEHDDCFTTDEVHATVLSDRSGDLPEDGARHDAGAGLARFCGAHRRLVHRPG
jgi:hypothetical protein